MASALELGSGNNGGYLHKKNQRCRRTMASHLIHFNKLLYHPSTTHAPCAATPTPLYPISYDVLTLTKGHHHYISEVFCRLESAYVSNDAALRRFDSSNIVGRWSSWITPSSLTQPLLLFKRVGFMFSYGWWLRDDKHKQKPTQIHTTNIYSVSIWEVILPICHLRKGSRSYSCWTFYRDFVGPWWYRSSSHHSQEWNRKIIFETKSRRRGRNASQLQGSQRTESK